MDFIFMLTRSDQTVPDCLEVWDQVKSLGMTHVGFKDVGVEPAILAELNKRIKASGAITYMEVVSTSAETSIKSAKIAKEIGIDRLLGGTQVEETMKILAGSQTKYYPFPGKPFDHPTKLGGTPKDVEEHCRKFQALGCAGVDLLAYRSTEADPVEMVRAARRGMSGYLVVAGAIRNAQQIKAIKDAGADAFTVGSAAFDGSWSPLKGSLCSQLKDIMEACR